MTISPFFVQNTIFPTTQFSRAIFQNRSGASGAGEWHGASSSVNCHGKQQIQLLGHLILFPAAFQCWTLTPNDRESPDLWSWLRELPRSDCIEKCICTRVVVAPQFVCGVTYIIPPPRLQTVADL